MFPKGDRIIGTINGSGRRCILKYKNSSKTTKQFFNSRIFVFFSTQCISCLLHYNLVAYVHGVFVMSNVPLGTYYVCQSLVMLVINTPCLIVMLSAELQVRKQTHTIRI
jgi:hypothetical protein